jgi:aryl-alcohol dehydrogenase-like predicted oxidoreductase
VLDLAFGWLLSRPAVASVIAGATRPGQITANVAGGTWRPGADVLAAVDTIAPR